MSWVSHGGETAIPLYKGEVIFLPKAPHLSDWIAFIQKDGFPGQWLRGRGCPIKSQLPSSTVSKQDLRLPLWRRVSLNKLSVLKLKDINTKTACQLAKLKGFQLRLVSVFSSCNVIIKFPRFLKDEGRSAEEQKSSHIKIFHRRGRFSRSLFLNSVNDHFLLLNVPSIVSAKLRIHIGT